MDGGRESETGGGHSLSSSLCKLEKVKAFLHYFLPLLRQASLYAYRLLFANESKCPFCYFFLEDIGTNKHLKVVGKTVRGRSVSAERTADSRRGDEREGLNLSREY